MAKYRFVTAGYKHQVCNNIELNSQQKFLLHFFINLEMLIVIKSNLLTQDCSS